MKKNAVRNGVIVMAILGAMGGAGTMAANASTTPTTTSAATTTTQDHSSQTAQAEDQAAAAAANPAAPTTSCVSVKVKNTGKSNAKLCATVNRSGLRVSNVRVTLTTPAKACSGKATLGATTDRGAAITRSTSCADGNRSTTTLTVNRTVADNSQVCGTLAANSRFAAARTCIRVTR